MSAVAQCAKLKKRSVSLRCELHEQ